MKLIEVALQAKAGGYTAELVTLQGVDEVILRVCGRFDFLGTNIKWTLATFSLGRGLISAQPNSD